MDFLIRIAAHLETIHTGEIDYDGDGNNREEVSAEIETMSETLLAAIRLYAAIVEGTEPIVYDGETRPYFFTESGEDYKTWTPRLYRAAYNYHYVMKNKGGYAHHAPYLMQLLYDSLESFGGRTFGMTRP